MSASRKAGKETTVRSLARIALAPLIITAACSGGSTDTAVDASLERDLRLASTASLALAPAGGNGDLVLETAPQSIQAPVITPRRAPRGERRVRSESPTVSAAPVAQQASGSDAHSVLETITQPTEDAAEADAADAVPLPRPAPVVIVDAGGGSGGYGDGGDGSTHGGGGWGGVVIRGGDIDDCRIEPRRTRRPARRPGGGVGDGRWPMGGERAGGVSGGRWPMGGDRGERQTGGSEGDRAGRWPMGRSGASSSGRNSGNGGGGSSGRWPIGRQ